MSTIQAHADAGLNLLRTDAQLTVFDGRVGSSPPDHYVAVHSFRQLPSGLVEPDKIKLTGRSTVVDMRFYCHCVGRTEMAARATAGRVEDLLLDVTLVVGGRTCLPLRWIEGQPPQRNEDTLEPSFDQVDVYGFQSSG
jgi:hypothetical protein